MIKGFSDLYFDLLEKVLTNTIYEDPPADPYGGPAYDAARRTGGLDWPSRAMTMIGIPRLRNIRKLCHDVLSREVPGDFIETGAWRGGACIYMRAMLKGWGYRDRTVFVADSFEGLPPPDPKFPADAGDRHHTQKHLSVSLEEVKENFRKLGCLDEQVVFLPGWFEDTLPKAPIEKLAILRLDGDMYGSTWTALEHLYPKLSPGGWCIVDDYGAVPACAQAVDEYRAVNGIADRILPIDGLGVYWKKSA